MIVDKSLFARIFGGQEGFTISREKQRDFSLFQFYSVELSDSRYRGFPPRWEFAVLPPLDKKLADADVESVAVEAQEFVQRAFVNASPFLFFVSLESQLRLADNLPHRARTLFYLDADEVPSKSERFESPRQAPFFVAIRKRLGQSDLSSLLFTPYVRNYPARDWRFFGRRKELDQLVNAQESFVVVGARQIGKTSLMLEAARRLEADGTRVFYVDVQDCFDEGQVVSRILDKIAPRDKEAAIRRQGALGEPLLASVLSKISAPSSSAARAVLFLDELGNVIAKLPQSQWRIMGLLRQHTQIGGLRVIISCFQEVFLRQQSEFDGPFVNFAITLRLTAFSPGEVEEFVTGPLRLWGDIGNPRAIRELVVKSIGRHPLLLQHFCTALFEKVTRQENGNVLKIAQNLCEQGLVSCFQEPVEEIFYRLDSPLLRYLFLRRCEHSEQKGEPLVEARIDDDWIADELAVLRYESSMSIRRNLLEGLEVRGLTEPKDDNRGVQVVIAPVVYRFVKRTTPDFGKLYAKFVQEISVEYEKWGLRKMSGREDAKGVSNA